MYTPSADFIRVVNSKELIDIYSTLTLIANNDRSLNEFTKAVDYVKNKNIPDFIKPFDESLFEPIEKWTKEYWEMVLFSLISNFSEERINHLKEISAYLYPKTNVSENTVTWDNVENKTATNPASGSNQDGSDNLKKNTTIAATVGAGLVCVMAVVIKAKELEMIGIQPEKMAALAWIGAVALGGYAVYSLFRKD